MTDTCRCPVCLSPNGSTCRKRIHDDSFIFECDICGTFRTSREAFEDTLDPDLSRLSPIERASLSHRLRTTAQESAQITTGWLEHFLANSALPSPAIQAANIIRFIGDEVLRTGERIPRLPVGFHAIVGSPNREFAARLAEELCDRGVLKGIDASSDSGAALLDMDLTLSGWERYEAEKRGKIAGRTGFIAMKFNDPILDPFVEDVVKPAVKGGIGYDLVHMRNVAQAGIIDNIMRAQIRDAAFVIVDLTHDNSGAYWEAGYAEGLGKPVIYICERAKFEAVKTHFDTNHCTTVIWSVGADEDFTQELVATLRRSLNLFPESTK